MVESILVRVESDMGTTTWLLPPQGLETLLRDTDQHAGTITVLDPDTCEDLASTSFEEGSAMMVVIHRGVTADGPWQIDSEVEEVDESSPLASVTGHCEGRP